VREAGRPSPRGLRQPVPPGPARRDPSTGLERRHGSPAGRSRLRTPDLAGWHTRPGPACSARRRPRGRWTRPAGTARPPAVARPARARVLGGGLRPREGVTHADLTKRDMEACGAVSRAVTKPLTSGDETPLKLEENEVSSVSSHTPHGVRMPRLESSR